MLSIIIGLVLIIGTIASLAYSISQTPDNLTGFYGFFYGLISLGGFIGGIALIATAFF